VGRAYKTKTEKEKWIKAGDKLLCADCGSNYALWLLIEYKSIKIFKCASCIFKITDGELGEK